MVDYTRKLVILVTDLNVIIWDLERILTNTTHGKLEGYKPMWTLPFTIRRPRHPYQRIPDWMHSWATFVSLNISYYTLRPIPGFDVLIYDDIAKGGKIYSYEFLFQDRESPSSPGTTKQGKTIDDLHPRVALGQVHNIPDYPTRDTGIKHNRLCDGHQVVLWENYRAGLYTMIKPSSVNDEPEDDNIHPPAHFYPIPDSTIGDMFPHIDENIVGTEMQRHSSVNPDVEYPAWAPHETAASRVEPIFGASTFDPASGRMCSTSVDGMSIILHDYLGEFGYRDEDCIDGVGSLSSDSTTANGKRMAVREAVRSVRNTFQSARAKVIGQRKH